MHVLGEVIVSTFLFLTVAKALNSTLICIAATACSRKRGRYTVGYRGDFSASKFYLVLYLDDT